MATTTVRHGGGGGEPSFFGSVRWGKAAQAGLIVGAILYLVSRGMPWTGSGVINPTIMGREIPPSQEATPVFFFGFLILHLLVSVVYGLILAPTVHGFRPMVAGFVGGLVGLILYFLNYAAFNLFFDSAAFQREWIAAAMHLAFGIITAETYKGMTRTRPVAL